MYRVYGVFRAQGFGLKGALNPKPPFVVLALRKSSLCLPIRGYPQPPSSAQLLSVLRLDCHLGGCQNYGPFLGPLKNRCRIIIGTQKGTIILTATHVNHKLHRCRGK